jgi:hypothetical protein
VATWPETSDQIASCHEVVFMCTYSSMFNWAQSLLKETFIARRTKIYRNLSLQRLGNELD